MGNWNEESTKKAVEPLGTIEWNHFWMRIIIFERGFQQGHSYFCQIKFFVAEIQIQIPNKYIYGMSI